MLKEKINGIRTIKLVSGEEILANVVSEDDTQITVTKPFIIVMSHQGVNMMPLSFTGDLDKEIPLNKNQIITIMESRKDAETDYLRITTGIEIPKEKNHKIIT